MRRALSLSLPLAALSIGAVAQGAPRLRLSVEGGVAEHVVGARAQRFVGVAAEVSLIPRSLELALGSRLATGGLTPDPAVSGLVRLSICAWQRPYYPAMGLEVELGPGERAHVASSIPDRLDESFNAANRDNALWTNLLIEPLRFEFGDYFVSGAGLRLGTPLFADSGRRLHLGISLLRIGYGPLP